MPLLSVTPGFSPGKVDRRAVAPDDAVVLVTKLPGKSATSGWQLAVAAWHCDCLQRNIEQNAP